MFENEAAVYGYFPLGHWNNQMAWLRLTTVKGKGFVMGTPWDIKIIKRFGYGRPLSKNKSEVAAVYVYPSLGHSNNQAAWLRLTTVKKETFFVRVPHPHWDIGMNRRICYR